MPFAGAGAFLGSSQAASANANRPYVISFDGAVGAFAATALINTLGVPNMTIQVTQLLGVAGTGGVALTIVPEGPVELGGPEYTTAFAPIVAIGIPQVVNFPGSIAAKSIRLAGLGSGVFGNPNLYRILFMSSI